MKPFLWFYSFIKKYKWRIAGGLILTAAVSSLSLITPYLSGQIVNQVMEGGMYERLWWMVALLIGATVLRGLLRAGYLMVFESNSQNIIYDMREFMYRHFMEQDFAFYNRHRTGDLMSRQTGDIEGIRHFLAYTLYAVFNHSVLFVVSACMIFMENVRLACCMLVVLVFTAVVTIVQFKLVHPAFKQSRDRFSSLNSFAQENIDGNRVVRAFAKEEYEKHKFAKENSGYMDAELAVAKLSSVFIPLFEFLSNLLLIVLLLIGGIMVIRGEMTLGSLVTINGYLYMLSDPLKQAGWLVNDIRRMSAGIEKIYATITQKPDIHQPKNPADKKQFQGKVEFKHVSYQVEDEDVLQDVSFCVRPGQKIGIIGATGAGKSTMMNLICRFADVTEGQVLVDDVDVREYDLHALRSNIGMAMQEIFLFSDTIARNIAYGNSAASPEEIERVAKIADADGFIRETPQGYDTIVGERGMGLSGGQKQRISLARALLKNPSIIILDDTTSAVDVETEGVIQKELKNIRMGTTVFVIAHRISSICDADQIFVLSQGQIIERGTHRDLIDANGYYASVYRHQCGDFDKPVERHRKKGADSKVQQAEMENNYVNQGGDGRGKK